MFNILKILMKPKSPDPVADCWKECGGQLRIVENSAEGYQACDKCGCFMPKVFE